MTAPGFGGVGMTPNPKIGSLFSGSGMLDEGARAVLGGSVAWHAEIDPAASKVLAYRYPDVPNLGDISAVDWAAVEPVDVITGGSPCQDVSHAGKRAGMRAGTRSGLWARMCDAIEAVRPAVVVWENVRGVLSAEADSALEPCPGCVGDGDDGAVLRALGRVLGDLADLGYDTGWHGLRAADVGAPHGRFRVFVVATDAERGGRVGRSSDAGRGPVERTAATRPGAGAATDARRDEPQRRGERRDVGGAPAAGDVDGGQRQRVRDAAGDSRATATDANNRTDYGQRPRAEPWNGGPPSADASDVGHERGRPTRAGRPGSADSDRPAPDTASNPGRLVDRDITAAADADDAGSQGGEPTRGQDVPDRCATPDAEGNEQRESLIRLGERAEPRRSGDGTNWGAYEPAIRRWEHVTGRPAPAPTEPGARGGQRLSPRLTEFMMGWPDGWVTDVPGITRNDALKICGNGVVPQQAAEAIRRLLPHLAACAA